ncbi:MAG: hypothetical protein ABJ308_10355 [Halieaceae bacterium]
MRRYLTCFFAIFLLLSVAVLFLNYRVDPFGAWRTHDKPLSVFSIGNVSYARLAKAHWIAQQQSDLVVLGNSHAVSAFQADQLRRHLDASTPFNLALLGTSLSEMTRNMRHAYYASGARRFLVVVDLLNFRDHTTARGNEFTVALALDDSLGSRYFAARNFAATTYSWAATTRSLLALRAGYLDSNTAEGFVKNCKNEIQGGPLSRLVSSAQARRDMFQSTDYLGTGDSTAWREPLGELMAFIAQQQLDVTFLVPPFHLSYYYALDASGAWDKHQQMLQLLVESIVAAGVEQHTHLVDFTAFNRYTGEFHSDPRARLDYWLDADHFNCAMAELIIARTAQLINPAGQIAPESEARLGARVTAANLAEHQRRLNHELQAWKAANPEAHAWLSRRIQPLP